MGRLRRAGGASLDAGKWDDAQAAAPKLDSFEQGLGATHDAGSPAHNVLIGHSYGSSVVGEAAKSAHGLGNLGVDDVIAVGSPGMDVNSASDLGVDRSGRQRSDRVRRGFPRHRPGTGRTGPTRESRLDRRVVHPLTREWQSPF